MKTNIHQQLKEVQDLWDRITVVPDELGSFGFPGLTKAAISNSIGAGVELAKKLEEMVNYEPPILPLHVVLHNINNMRQYAASHIPSNPQPHIIGFITFLDAVLAALSSWLESTDKKGKYAAPHLLRTLAESVSAMKSAENLYKQLNESSSRIAELASQSISQSEEIKKSRSEVEIEFKASSEIVEKIRSNQDESAKKSKEILDQLAVLQGLKEELERNKSTQEELFNKFESYREQISDLIGAGSQVGMAHAFRSVKMDHERSMRYWLIGFIGAVVTLAEIGVLYVAPAISASNWIELLIKLPLTFPLVWLAWFFAKQYGYTVRLREDYSFKYASAMSFEAHKREASQIDQELLKKLLQLSVNNFAENPLRIFGTTNHASPLHEGLESILKDDSLIDKFKSAYKKVVKSE